MTKYNAYYSILNTGTTSLKLDEAISKDCTYSYFYSINVLKGRFELGEEIISKNSSYALYYAKYVLKARFELGEEVISKNCYNSYDYAKDVMRYDHE